MQALTDDQFRRWSLGLRDGARWAYAELFDATYDPLLRYAVYITHDGDAAHDVLQDVFAKLWHIRATIDPERSLKALLYQMVRNYALNHERYKKRHATDTLEDAAHELQHEATTAAEMDAARLNEQILRWIDAMPERRREAFMLSRYENLSHDEIARLMGLTPKTVNNHIVLALKYLREQLERYQQ